MRRRALTISTWPKSALEVILGCLTFTGSLMAAGKLQESSPTRPITYKGQNLVNLGTAWPRRSSSASCWSSIPAWTVLFPLIMP